MVSRAIWKNIHSWVFQRLQITLVIRSRVILTVFEKLTRACFSKLYSKPYYYLYIFDVFFTSSSSQTNRACDEKCQDGRRSEEDGGRCSFTRSVRLVNLLLYPLYHFSCSEYFHKSGSVLELSLTFNTRSTRVWSDHVQFNSALLKSNHINLLFSDVSLVSMRALQLN